MPTGEPTAAVSDHSGLNIVAVEDRPDDVEMIRFALEDAGLAAEVWPAEDAASLQTQLERGPDIVLCDYNLPKFSPQAALAMIREMGLRVPLVVVTRAIGEAAAVDVLRHGARDYVAKDKLATLAPVIRRVLADDRTAHDERLAQERLQTAHARLREMSAHMIGVQERERQLIAGELHDVLGQTLTSVLLHLEASDRSDDPTSSATYRRTAEQLVREALDQVKTLSFTLRPAQLDLLGLASAVRAAAEMQLRPLGITAPVRVHGAVDDGSALQVAVLYRIVLEALTNIVRHAGAARVRITLAMRSGGRLSATVLDDGVGFDVSTVLRSADTARHLGLTGMLERCELAGGRLRIRSRRGRGTVVHVNL